MNSYIFLSLDSSYLIVILEVAVLFYCHIFYLMASLLKEQLFLDSITLAFPCSFNSKDNNNFLLLQVIYLFWVDQDSTRLQVAHGV